MPRRSVRHPGLHLERLDDRSLPSIHFNHGTLTIFGTGGNDLIQVTYSGHQIVVGGQSFDASQVQMIVVDAGDGDDTVTIDPQITATTWLFGRLGNDRLVGGGGLNHLYGGHGNDVLIGGPGRNVLVGGSGTNSIQAQPDDTVTNGQPDVGQAPSPMSQQILDLVNQQRLAAGLAPLQWSVQLAFGADVHSRNMASMATVVGPSAAMAHLLLGVNAPTLGSRADLAGYDYRALGENVAYGYASAAAVVDAWMNSPGHRANILSTSFTQVGIAVAYSAHGLPYYTQFFGSPAMPSTATSSGHPAGNLAVQASSNPSPAPPASSPTATALAPVIPSPTPTTPPNHFRRTAATLRVPSLALTASPTITPSSNASHGSPTLPVIRVQSNRESGAATFHSTVAPERPSPTIALQSPPLSIQSSNPVTTQVPATTGAASATANGPGDTRRFDPAYRLSVRTFRWSIIRTG